MAYLVAEADAEKAVERGGRLQDCCYTVIEVLDPNTGALLGTGKVAPAIMWILEGGYLVGWDTGPDDEWLAPLYRARLVVPG